MDKLAIETWGDDAKPALLLVHGFLSSNLQWEPNREALGRHLRLVAAELWGHGASPAPRDPARYRVASYLSEFECVRRRLGIGRWFVCGQSFGAGIAMRYALVHPEVVRGLVVTNSRSALSDVTTEAGAAMGRADWEALDLRRLPFHPCHARRFPEALKAKMEAAADRIDGYALWQAAQTTVPELSCRKVASQLAVPTLLVNGRWERAFQDDRAFARATIPDLAVADLDGGHSVNIEASRDFDAAVIDFATRHA